MISTNKSNWTLKSLMILIKGNYHPEYIPTKENFQSCKINSHIYYIVYISDVAVPAIFIVTYKSLCLLEPRNYICVMQFFVGFIVQHVVEVMGVEPMSYKPTCINYIIITKLRFQSDYLRLASQI